MSNNTFIIQGQKEKEQGIHIEINSNEPALGEGNFGVVRKGILVDEKTGSRREVAVKFLYEDLSENAILRSQKEASIHIVHENLVEMIGFICTEDGNIYSKARRHYHVVSELLHGVMLYDLVEGKITNKEGVEIPALKEFYEQYQNDKEAFAIRITRSILSGIMSLHDNGYIHRDIDPSNVMITEDGKIKLIDLGIAKALNPAKNSGPMLTNTGDFVGKAAYAAPELVIGDIANQNATTDIYAIGIMLYQLITGKLPFNGTLHEILDKQVKENIPLSNITNKQLRGIIKKATEKKQADRFQSAAEFRVKLDQLGKREATNRGDQPSPYVPSGEGNSILLWVAAIAGGLALGAAIGMIV